MLVWEYCCQWIMCSCTIITATAFSVAIKCNAKWISLYLTTSCWMFMVVSGRPPPPKNYDRTWPGARLKSVEKSNPLLISSFMSAACDEWKRLGKWRLHLFVRITFGEGLQRACNCNLVHFLSDMVINHTCAFGFLSIENNSFRGLIGWNVLRRPAICRWIHIITIQFFTSSAQWFHYHKVEFLLRKQRTRWKFC